MCVNMLLAGPADGGMQLGSTVEAMMARHRLICEPPKSSQLSAADHRAGTNRKSERRQHGVRTRAEDDESPARLARSSACSAATGVRNRGLVRPAARVGHDTPRSLN